MAPLHSMKDMWTEWFVFSLEEITAFPLSFQLGLLVFVMGHIILRKPNTERSSSALTSRQWRSLHQHRLEEIQAMNQELAREETRFSDATFSSIVFTFSIEVRKITSISPPPQGLSQIMFFAACYSASLRLSWQTPNSSDHSACCGNIFHLPISPWGTRSSDPVCV